MLNGYSLRQLIFFPAYYIQVDMAFWGFLVDQLVKNPPARQETPVQFLGWEDPLEKGMATHSRILGLPWWLRQ